MVCKICNGQTKKIFISKILNKYEVQYFQCENCDFIQTETPYWIQEAYEFEKTGLDVGLVYRNLQLSEQTEKVIFENFNKHGGFLDFAGGTGLFVRLMRDKGFNFFWKDKYCKNIFASFFEFDPSIHSKQIELVTAFEVMEHFVNPIEELDNIFKFSKNLLFSTEMIPDKAELKNWWYIVPEGGQHIAFYNEKTFIYIANRFNLKFYTNGSNLHLFTDKSFNRNPFEQSNLGRVISFFERSFRKISHRERQSFKTLLQNDFEYVKNKIVQETIRKI